MDNDGTPAFHITDRDTGSEDYITSRINRVDNRMIEDRDIPIGCDGPLDPALAPDNGIPAADINGDTGPRTEFE
jgi:hypothetical protein